MLKRILILLIIGMSWNSPIKTQTIYYSHLHTDLYEFLDELATQQIIQINSVIKPYSRKFIAKWLSQAQSKKEHLTRRQLEELTFYLKDFNKELKKDVPFIKRWDAFYYSDSIFSFTLNPILGGEILNNETGTIKRKYWGAGFWGYIGNNLGIYGSLRDKNEEEILSFPDYFTQQRGAKYKYGDNTDGDDTDGDNSESRGGITLSGKWGSLSLVKDYFVWGNNYNGATIFSDRAPSFGQLKLHLHPVSWFEFNYIHGWLVSEIIDSTRSYQYEYAEKYFPRTVLHNKYIAANMFTFKPSKYLSLSFGNSIIYSDINVQASYLIPFLFYKSVDHSIGAMNNHSGQNSQMYFDISSRQLKNVHLFTSFFIDEISFQNMFHPSKNSNFLSFKIGGRLYNLIDNFFLTAEYTRNNPLVYQHIIETTDNTSNQFNLGHYLKDNSQNVYVSAKYKSLKGLSLQGSFSYSEHGPNYWEFTEQREALPFMETVDWREQDIKFTAKYQIINDGFIYGTYNYKYTKGNVERYNPQFYRGETRTIIVGFNYGF